LVVLKDKKWLAAEVGFNPVISRFFLKDTSY